MTTSSNIIDSVLDNLKSLIARLYEFANVYSESLKKYSCTVYMRFLKVETTHVRSFVLCAKSLSIYGWEDARLEPFLSELQDAVLGQVQAFYALTQHGVSSRHDVVPIKYLQKKFESFRGEISTIYCSLRDFVPPSSHDSALTTTDEVLQEFVDSVLENLVNQGSEPIQEKLKLLKGFIPFAKWRGVDSSLLKASIYCLHHVAVQAAYLSYRLRFDRQLNTEDIYNEMIAEVYLLYKSWIQGLMASESSGPIFQTLYLEKDMHIVGDFSDSLMCILWEVLNHERGFAVAKHDQMLVFYDGVRFLRTILKKQPEKFNGLHQKMKDFVGSVVIEAGILVLECSLTVNALKKSDLEFSDLLQKIKLIKLVTSKFKSPRANEIGSIKFLLKNLRELAELDLIAHSKNQIRIVLKQFVILEECLEKIAEHCNKHEKLIAFLSRVIAVANKVMFVINSFDLSPLSFCSNILEELQLLHVETEILKVDKTYDSEAQKVEKTFGYVSSQDSIPKLNNVVEGFKDETESIIDRVRRGSKKLDILSIVGMPGLGKTTLARKVYSDPSIIRHFHIRTWCNVSQVYVMKDLLLEILGCVNPESSGQYSQMDEADLAHKLLNSLQRCRYFIILDDVWDIDAWNILKRSFPDDEKGSRILITSRLYEVASQLQADSEPHRLRQFTDVESWDLLRKMLFRNGDCPPELCTVGKQIARNCGGLPLTVVIVAGILATTPQDGWKEFAEKTTTRTVISSTQQPMDMLELSYRHVPDLLKPCLLYIGAFPQGQKIPVKKLLQLWVAEGFVQRVEQKNIDEVAKDYMMDLVCRSLIMVVERSRIDVVERCHVHDLIHEFCATKAKEENFLQFLHGYDDLYSFSELDNTRRLCIYSETEYFEKSRLFCPHVCSLIFSSHGDVHGGAPDTSLSIFKFCKRLRVLDLEKVYAYGGAFPTELLMMVELRYLAIGGYIRSIPSLIANLSNLESFNLALGNCELPKTIWNMTNLRHVNRIGYSGRFVIPKCMPENSSILYNLSTFSCLELFLDPSMENILRKFPNIHTLVCQLSKSEGEGRVPSWSKVVKMDFLSKLESLDLSFYGYCDIQVQFPLNLKKLCLCKFSWYMISAIKKLPNLEELKLASNLYDKGDVSEARWDMTEEVEFSKLKILELSRLKIVRWTGSGDHFPCLQTLTFYRCGELKEVPSCLGSNSPLEMVEICRCSRSLVDCAKEISKEQQEMGNVKLQIRIIGDKE